MGIEGLYHILIGEGVERCRPLRGESKWRALRRREGDRWFVAWCRLLVSPVIKANLPRLMKSQGRGCETNEFLWRICHWAGRGNSEKASSPICCFFRGKAQNNQYIKASYFVLAFPEFLNDPTLVSLWGKTLSLWCSSKKEIPSFSSYSSDLLQEQRGLDLSST